MSIFTALIAYSEFLFLLILNFIVIHFGIQFLSSINLSWYWGLLLSAVLVPIEIAIGGKVLNWAKPPLHRVASSGRVRKVQRLIQDGIDVNEFDRHGETALSHAVEGGHIEAVKALLEAGADPNLVLREGDNYHSPIHYACGSRGAKEIVELLIKHGADANARGAWGDTPLSWAIGDIRTVRLLLDNGADVNLQDEKGRTLLHELGGESVELAALLIARGADVNAKDNDGISPLQWHSGELGNRNEEIAELLVSSGANPHTKDKSGNTPLHAAAFSGSIRTAELLIANGLDVNARNNNGETPLHNACKIGAWRLPAGPGILFTTPDSVKHLIRSGADVSARDNRGKTPLQVAIENKRQDLIEILNEYRAGA